MAIDRNRLKFFISDIDELFASFPRRCRNGSATGFRLGDGAGIRRIARIHRGEPAAGGAVLAGRSGHGKSSVINALAGREDCGDRHAAHHAASAGPLDYLPSASPPAGNRFAGIFETSPPGGAHSRRHAGAARRDAQVPARRGPAYYRDARGARPGQRSARDERNRWMGCAIRPAARLAGSRAEQARHHRQSTRMPPERYTRKAAQIKESSTTSSPTP